MTAAHDLMVAMRYVETVRASLAVEHEGMVGMIRRFESSIPKQVSAADIQSLEGAMESKWHDEMDPLAIASEVEGKYATIFSVEELRELAKFYRTPAGIALVAHTLDVQRESAAVWRAHMQVLMPSLLNLQQRFNREHKIDRPALGASVHADKASH